MKDRKLTEAKQKEIFKLLKKGIIRPDQKIVVLFDRFNATLAASELERMKRERLEFDSRMMFQPANKPRGLWWACGDAWLDWCAWNMFNPGQYVYELTLRPGAHICRFGYPNRFDIDSFSQEFGQMKQNINGTPYGLPDPNRIMWRYVEYRFDGIEICPLPMEGPDWIELWDVPSGCVWEPKAIAHMRMITQFKT